MEHSTDQTPRSIENSEHAGAAFRKLWKLQYGQDIKEEQAAEYEDRLVRLVKALMDIELHRERSPP